MEHFLHKAVELWKKLILQGTVDIERSKDAPLFVCAAMRKSHTEVEAMKRQAKGLAQEYDRLLREHHQLQVTQIH